MIRVKVDLVPYGDEDNTSQIGELVLANVANLGLGIYKYKAVLKTDMGEVTYKTVDHMRQSGFWELIRNLIEADDLPDDSCNTFKRLEGRLTI